MALLDHRGGEREAVLLIGFDEDALAAGVVHDVLVGDPVRHRDDDFVAGVDQRLREIEEHMLAAHGDDAFGRLVVGAEIRLVARDRRPASVRWCRRRACTW